MADKYARVADAVLYRFETDSIAKGGGAREDVARGGDKLGSTPPMVV